MNTFKTFIKDKSNHFALAACQAIAKQPSEYCNPLWIYGESACGKSHLLNAISHKLEHEQVRVALSLTADALVEAMISNFITANQTWSTIENADVLIIDNIECLKGMDATQKEIAVLCLRKQANKQQVVFASTCPPAELPVLNRLFSEHTGTGLIVAIQPPSTALKHSYLERFMEDKPFPIDKEAIELLISDLKTIPQLNKALQVAHFSNSADKAKINTGWVLNNLSEFKEL